MGEGLGSEAMGIVFSLRFLMVQFYQFKQNHILISPNVVHTTRFTKLKYTS